MAGYFNKMKRIKMAGVAEWVENYSWDGHVLTQNTNHILGSDSASTSRKKELISVNTQKAMATVDYLMPCGVQIPAPCQF